MVECFILGVQHEEYQIKPASPTEAATQSDKQTPVTWQRGTLHRDSNVCGIWMFSTTVSFSSHWDILGFAAARMLVRAFSWQMMPALAMDRVCCS